MRRVLFCLWALMIFASGAMALVSEQELLNLKKRIESREKIEMQKELADKEARIRHKYSTSKNRDLELKEQLEINKIKAKMAYRCVNDETSKELDLEKEHKERYRNYASPPPFIPPESRAEWCLDLMRDVPFSR